MDAATSIFTSVPIDWFIVGGVVAIFAIDSLRSGIGRAVALALAAPLGLLLFSLVDSTLVLKDVEALQDSSMAQAVLILVLIALCFVMLRRMGIEYFDSGVRAPLQSILAAASTTAILLVVWMHAPAFSDWYTFGDQMQAVFSESYRLWWILGSFATLTFVRG